MAESIEMTLDRIRWLAQQIEQAEDSHTALERSQELRLAAADLRARLYRLRAAGRPTTDERDQ